MKQEKYDKLTGILSDKEHVDWDRLLRDAPSDDERRWLENLRVISAVSGLANADAEPGIERTTVLEGPSASESASADGTSQWGSLRLLEKVGSGGFGEVHRAWDPALNRQVALKLMRADRGAGADWKEKILAEGRLLAKVEHPNVARVYGVETHGDRVGIAMEFVEGTDLGSLLRERGLYDAREAAAIGVELCDALSAVHAANVVHKDIKPQNVLRDPSGRLVITDFGAGRVRRVRDGETELTVVGTARYMAPELFQREPATPQSDIYALGVLLYQLVTGATPVDGTAREIVDAHQARRRVTLSQAQPGLPEAFVAVVDRALQPRREDRFSSTAAMREALQAFVNGPAPTAVMPPRARSRWMRVGLPLAAAIAVLAFFVGRSLWSSGVSAEMTFTKLRDGQRTELAARDEIAPSDQLVIEMEPSRDAHVYVINIDRTGAGTLMFPMRGGDLQNPIPGGGESLLPGEVGGEPFAWSFDATQGMEKFLVVVSHDRLVDFEQELNKIAAVDVGGGVSYAMLGDATMGILLRGVAGASPIAASDGADPDPIEQLLEMARKQADADDDGAVRLYEMELFNAGR